MTDRATRHTVTALFEHPSAAQDAATALLDAGFDRAGVKLFPGASEDVLRYERNLDPDAVQRGFMPPENGGALGFVVGFLGGGLLGLMLGSGALNVMGREPAMAAGPFWSAAIGAVVLGLGGALAGYLLNSPLPKLEPPLEETLRRRPAPTVVSVVTDAQGVERAREAIERAAPSSVRVWRADNGDWSPLAPV
ncbi:MAG: hypothetical protein GX560_01485 [Deinococcales bacterium]|nr:hypothetical protein [Deinococcales bacterium]